MPYKRGPTVARKPMDAADHVINEYEWEALRYLEHPTQEKFYGYQPFRLDFWMHNMELAYEYLCENGNWTGNQTFLDVGCGLGIKLRLAEAMGWNVEGIERWEPYANVALSAGFKVTLIDAFDYKGYDQFDLVYIYRPCIDADDEWDLLEYVVEQMRPGTLLFHAGGGRGRSPDLDHLGDNLWIVGVLGENGVQGFPSLGQR